MGFGKSEFGASSKRWNRVGGRKVGWAHLHQKPDHRLEVKGGWGPGSPLGHLSMPQAAMEHPSDRGPVWSVL